MQLKNEILQYLSKFPYKLLYVYMYVIQTAGKQGTCYDPLRTMFRSDVFAKSKCDQSLAFSNLCIW